MKTYDICYGFPDDPYSDTSMWMYEKAESMSDMIRKLVRYYSNELEFRILDMSEQVTTIYIPVADVNGEGEFRRIYLYGSN